MNSINYILYNVFIGHITVRYINANVQDVLLGEKNGG